MNNIFNCWFQSDTIENVLLVRRLYINSGFCICSESMIFIRETCVAVAVNAITFTDVGSKALISLKRP